MYIEIADDIISIILDKKHHNYDDVIWFLQEVALCMKRRKHYISIPALRKNGKLKHKLKETFPKTFGLLAQTDNSDSKELKERIKWYMVVTKNIPDDSDGHILYYNPIYNHNFEIFEETHLICENLYDCAFYDLIFRAYSNHYKIPGIIHNYLPRNGGGATTSTVVRNEIKSRNHLCLIITDSDRRYRPVAGKEDDDSGLGNTYRKIKKVITENPYEFMHLHVLGNTREAENLIPHSILLQNSPDVNTDNLIKQCDTSFFDFKEGLRYSDLNAEVEYLYWTPIMDIIKVNHQKRHEFKETAKKTNKTYHALVKDEPPLISGFGNTLLSTVLENHKKELASQDFKKLTEDQRNDWNEIGSLLFSWSLSNKYI